MIDDDCSNPHYDMDIEPIYTCYIIIHIIINICRFGQMFIFDHAIVGVAIFDVFPSAVGF